MAAQQQQEQQLEGIHKYKISPPRFTGEYNTFEEWNYEMTAYLGLERPTRKCSTFATNGRTMDTTEQQLARHFLVNTCDGPAPTICRQNMQGNGFETWRLIHARYSITLGTRSITRLLKPQLDEQKFEESFTTWEFQLSKYEQDNSTLLDAVKIAMLLNETKGPLQQHLQVGNITTYAQIRLMVIEYYRATASFTRLQAITSGNNSQGPAPMDIGATWYNKGKGKKGKHKRKGKRNKGTGYNSYGNNYGYSNYKGGKGKYNQQPVGQGNPFKGQKGYDKGKGHNNKGKGKGYYSNQQGGKGAKGKQATNVCYRCGQPGHMAKQCRVAIYNCDAGTFDANDQTDDWYNQAHYDNNWYHQTTLPQAPQVADPSAAPISGLHEVTIAMIGTTQQPAGDNKKVSLIIDSGAATHVCPPWCAPQFPLHQLEHGTGPQLRTVTNQHIKLFGYRWVCMTNHSGQQIVIPFYVCEVKQPILSVEQGFQLTSDDNPRLQRIKGFNSTLENRNGLFFLPAEIATLPKGTTLQIHSTEQGQIGMIAPTTTLTPQGPADTGYAGDDWQFNTKSTCQSTQARQEDTFHTTEQPKGKMRINAIKFTTKDGKQLETTSNEDIQEIESKRILLEPVIHDTEGLDPQQVAQAMKKDAQQMNDQSVFTEISLHRDRWQHNDTRTTSKHHRIKMGS